MAAYREEGRFVIRLELSAEFADDYEGDLDGYAWLDAWKAKVRPRLLGAMFDALRADPHFAVVPVSRGKNPDDEVEVAVTLKP